MAKILLIDDSDEIAELIESGLSPYFVRRVASVSEASAALKEAEYDLILIDVILPDGNGFDLCMQLSTDSMHSHVPRMILTAKDQVSEKVYAFNCGADDYLTKPFHMAELRARVDRKLKQGSDNTNGCLNYGLFSFNMEFQRCHVLEGQTSRDLALTPTEFRLFLTLVKNKGRVLSRKFLELVAWEAQGSVIEVRGIDTHVAHLRKKLGAAKNQIISIYGQGYCFKDPTELAS